MGSDSPARLQPPLRSRIGRVEHSTCIVGRARDGSLTILEANAPFLASSASMNAVLGTSLALGGLDSGHLTCVGAVSDGIERVLSGESQSFETTCRFSGSGSESWTHVVVDALESDEDRVSLVQLFDQTEHHQEARRQELVRQLALRGARGRLEELPSAIRAACGWIGVLEVTVDRGRALVRELEGERRSEIPIEQTPSLSSALFRRGVHWDEVHDGDALCAAMGLTTARGQCCVAFGDRLLIFVSACAARPDNQLLDRIARAFDLEESTRSPATRPIDALVARAASSDATVLLLGESGTGKTRLGKLIHHRSARAERPFIDLNCAGLAPTLLESELFGHERGAFTGAHARKRGLLELAAGGTVLLDEIGELDALVQAKLLKVLESRRFRRVGGEAELAVDVRFIAATHRDLRAEVRAGRFREDLYYRLNVVEIRLPPLRERASELPTLAAELLSAMPSSERGPYRLSDGARRFLSTYDWPGNVRELRNVLERAALIAEHPVIEPEHLEEAMPRGERSIAPDALSEHTRRHILDALESTQYNIRRAAAALGIARSTLYEWIRREGLDVRERRLSKVPEATRSDQSRPGMKRR